MSIAATPTLFTPEDLLKMPDGDQYELVDGRLVERKRSTWASFVVGNVFQLLANYCFSHTAGWPFLGGISYQCFPANPSRVRKADVSVFRWERRTLNDFQTEGHCPLVPDLVVEVISPNDEVYEVDAKVQEWLDAGVHCIWVVNPVQRTVAVHRAKGAGTILRESDELSGEDAVPGFRCQIGEFFTTPTK